MTHRNSRGRRPNLSHPAIDGSTRALACRGVIRGSSARGVAWLAIASTSLFAGVALAAPTVGKVDPPQVEKVDPKLCPTPSPGKCLDKGTKSTPPYIETLCGRMHKDVCAPVIGEKLRQHYESVDAPKVKMLRPQRHELPTDLREGKYFPYKPKKKLSQVGATVSKIDLSLVPVDRVTDVSAATASKAHRTPAWEANGERVTSCAEFGYEMVYDINRFIDAATACRGDLDCVIDVAYLPTTPGIAGRTLARRDGKKAALQMQLFTGKLPKNDFFALGAAFITSRGNKPLPDVPALRTSLTQGAQYYEIGAGGASSGRKFASEWTWHKELRSRTASLSDAEFEEYERRKAELRALLDAWHAAVRKEKEHFDPQPEVGIILPYDMQTHDPFERLQHGVDVVREGVQLEQKARSKLSPKQLQEALGGAGRQGALAPGWGVNSPPVGVLAAPTPQPAGSQPQPQQQPAGSQPQPQQQPPGPQVDPCAVHKQWGMELFKAGPISCRIGQFMRREWQHKLDGKKSCLDLGNDDCDWSPKMFHERFVEKVPGLNDSLLHERTCQAWTGGTLDQPNLSAAEHYIKSMREQVGAAMQLLKPYEDKGGGLKGKKFGQKWSDGGSLGDRAWFAAEYSYDAGWEVEAVERDANDNVCELAGKAQGGGALTAHLMDEKIDVVDLLLRGTVNQKANHKGTIEAKFKLLGQELFNEKDETYAQTFEKSAGEYSMQVPPGWKPSFTFMAGPVPVTGAAWGELSYANIVRFTPKAPVGCNFEDPSFGLSLGFQPTFLANARAQIGVGVSGVVSAGIRGTINLLTLALPLEFGMYGQIKTTAGNKQGVLALDLSAGLMLATLSGRISAYLEFLMFEEEWELFRWSGIGPARFDLLPPLTTELPLVGMK